MSKTMDPNRVEGNSQVCDLLTKWLEFAQQGDMRFVGLVACRTSEDVVTDCAGAQGTEFAAYFGLDELKKNLANHLKNRSMPIQSNAEEDPAAWIYSIAQWTVGYDFFQWLVNVEVIRRREKVEGPLKVYFYPGQDGSWENALNNDARKQMFYKVCRPMVPLIGAVEIDKPAGRYLDHTKAFSYKTIIQAYRDGIELPKFQAPASARKFIIDKFGDRRPVIITLRETELHSYRNSDTPEWFKFAQYLSDKNYDVVFVRDTRFADEPLEHWETVPEASKELDIRMALYEIGRHCFFGSNGPFGLVTISDIPWTVIYPLDNSKSYKYNNKNVWESTMGIKAGEQFPWCRPDQRFILKPDTFENLVEAWEDLGK
jgi:hypothetical protein